MATIVEQAQAAIATFPTLSLSEGEGEVVLSGTFVLEQGGVPFDEYSIELRIPSSFPDQEPVLFETGGRIPRSPDLHVNDDGSACYEVFEYWLATTHDQSVLEFIRGPVLNFFLSQTMFNLTGEWPFGERSHGADGVIEATAQALGVENDSKVIAPSLRVLRDWPSKGHHVCPCGSERRFRDCHRDALAATHDRIPPALARRMVDRILKSIEAARKAEAALEEELDED